MRRFGGRGNVDRAERSPKSGGDGEPPKTGRALSWAAWVTFVLALAKYVGEHPGETIQTFCKGWNLAIRWGSDTSIRVVALWESMTAHTHRELVWAVLILTANFAISVACFFRFRTRKHFRYMTWWSFFSANYGPCYVVSVLDSGGLQLVGVGQRACDVVYLMMTLSLVFHAHARRRSVVDHLAAISAVAIAAVLSVSALCVQSAAWQSAVTTAVCMFGVAGTVAFFVAMRRELPLAAAVIFVLYPASLVLRHPITVHFEFGTYGWMIFQLLSLTKLALFVVRDPGEPPTPPRIRGIEWRDPDPEDDTHDSDLLSVPQSNAARC